MAEKKLLRINQRIQVRRYDIKEWYNSNIQEIKRGYIYISMPFLKIMPLILRNNEEVLVRFFASQSSYTFKTRVVNLVTDNITLYKLEYPVEIKRVQQRRHVRLPIIINVEYAVPGEGEMVNEYKKTTTLDLSGGGMKIVTREKVPPGTTVLLVFTLPFKNEMEVLEVNSEVVRCDKAEPNREIYHLGLKFKNVLNNQEDKIVRFIFEKMAQQKRLQ